MEIRQLEIFVAVVELGSFTKAADRLMIAQPAVSQAMKSLEDRLGLVLMTRSRSGIELTSGGKALLESALLILAEVDRGARRSKMAALGLAGSLRIGFLGSATAPFLPDLIREFRRRFPDVSIELTELTPKLQIEAFAQGQIDVGCNRPLPAALRSEFRTQLVYEDRLVLAAPSDHPLASRSSIAPAELIGQDFVFFHASQAPDLMYLIRGLLRDVPFRVAAEPELMATVLLMVASGLGLSIVPGCVRHIRQPGVAFVELEGVTERIPLEIAHRINEVNPAAHHWVRLVAERRDWIRSRMEACGWELAEE